MKIRIDTDIKKCFCKVAQTSHIKNKDCTPLPT